MLRVSFKDNDFRTVVENACEDVMFAIHHDIDTNEQSLNNKDFVERVRKGIVLASYGYYVAEYSTRLSFSIDYKLEDREHTIYYLDNNIDIKLVDDFNENDWNGETCYIDFDKLEVYVK